MKANHIAKTYDINEKCYAFKVMFYDGGEKHYKNGAAADKFARKCALNGINNSLHALTANGWIELAAC